MPDLDIEYGASDVEFSADVEQFDTGHETQYQHELEPAATFEEPVREHLSPVEAALEALFEHTGGNAEEWQLVDRGSGEYRFDGEDIVDREGGVWTNPDTELHQALLEQWRDGGEAIFFLPDYTETKHEGDTTIETLYVTQLQLDRQSGDVSWTIQAHESSYTNIEETSEPTRSNDRITETSPQFWDEPRGTPRTIEPVDERAAEYAAAAEALNAEESVEAADSVEDDSELRALIRTLLADAETAPFIEAAEARSDTPEAHAPDAVSPLLQAVGIRPPQSGLSAQRSASVKSSVHTTLNGIHMIRS